jgi:hypothetical protein
VDDLTLARGPARNRTNFNTLGLRMAGGRNNRLVSLLRFDLTPVARGTRVTSAQLELSVNHGSSSNFLLYQSLRPWSEGDASWGNVDDKTAWNQPGAGAAGADRGEKVLGVMSAPTPETVSVLLNADGLALVQAWIDGQQPNDGFVLSSPDAAELLVAHDREEVEPTLRPGLILEIESSDLAGNSAATPGSGPTGGNLLDTPEELGDAAFHCGCAQGPSEIAAVLALLLLGAWTPRRARTTFRPHH